LLHHRTEQCIQYNTCITPGVKEAEDTTGSDWTSDVTNKVTIVAAVASVAVVVPAAAAAAVVVVSGGSLMAS